jgi:nucleoside-diphosphate-sugar epimerase
MNVLALGATGFIGPHIVRQLVDRGCTVTIFHRGGTHAEVPRSVRYMFGDRDHLSAFKTSFAQLAPDVVLDVIPYTEKHAADLVRVFTGIAHRLVVLSSGDVYRNYGGLWGNEHHEPDPVPLTEDAPVRDHLYLHRSQAGLAFPYKDDYEKILVERVALSAPQLPGTVLRLPCVFGPGDRHHRLRPYLKRMEDGRSAILLDDRQAGWLWTRGYVENVAAAIVLALLDERASGRVYNVGQRAAQTEESWVRTIGHAAGWTGNVVPLSSERLPAHLRTSFDWRYHLATDTSRLREELGFREPISEEEALARTLEWERCHPVTHDELEQFDYTAEDAALRGAA